MVRPVGDRLLTPLDRSEPVLLMLALESCDIFPTRHCRVPLDILRCWLLRRTAFEKTTSACDSLLTIMSLSERQQTIVAVVSLFVILSWVLVPLRCYARLKVVRRLAVEDWIMILALVSHLLEHPFRLY